MAAIDTAKIGIIIKIKDNVSMISPSTSNVIQTTKIKRLCSLMLLTIKVDKSWGILYREIAFPKILAQAIIKKIVTVVFIVSNPASMNPTKSILFFATT